MCLAEIKKKITSTPRFVFFQWGLNSEIMLEKNSFYLTLFKVCPELFAPSPLTQKHDILCEDSKPIVIIKKTSKRYAVVYSRWACRYPNLNLQKMSFSETETEEANLKWNSIFSKSAAWGYLRHAFCQHWGLRNESVRRWSNAKIAILHRERDHVFWLEGGRVFN